MKNHYVILFLLISTACSYAQTANRIMVNYGINSHILIGPYLDGAASRDGKGGSVAGLRYFRDLSRKLALETGLEYSHYKFSISPAIHPDLERTSRKETVKLISVPVFVHYTFAKYLFVNGGLMADFQIDKKKTDVVDEQSGLGLGIGLGGKYSFKNITLSLNPYWQQHTIVPFTEVSDHERLMEAGIRLGVGYSF